MAYDPADEDVTLCEMLDRVLNRGVVVSGEIVISVANIELLYVGAQAVLCSVESARGLIETSMIQNTPTTTTDDAPKGGSP